MALDLNAMAGQTATTYVDFMGQTAKVTFDPTALTAANYDKTRGGDDDGFVEFFTELVKSWDVKKGNKTVPITKAGLREVPLPFLRVCMSHILAMKDGDLEEGKASSGISQPKDRLAKSRRGTA